MIFPNGYTEVDGSTKTGLYAADGSFNVVDRGEDDPEVPVGVFHPCGAYNVIFTEDPPSKTYAPNGSLYVQTIA